MGIEMDQDEYISMIVTIFNMYFAVSISKNDKIAKISHTLIPALHACIEWWS